MLIPPRQMGETLTAAVGDRIRWRASVVSGGGAGPKIDGISVVVRFDKSRVMVVESFGYQFVSRI